MSSENERIYKVTFLNQGQLYEVFARHVGQGGLFGFVEVEELLFGERSQVLVDPSEEKLRSEFKGVQRFYIPLHSVVRIDEVEKEGVGRITKPEEGSNITPFPGPIYTPSGAKGKD